MRLHLEAHPHAWKPPGRWAITFQHLERRVTLYASTYEHAHALADLGLSTGRYEAAVIRETL